MTLFSLALMPNGMLAVRSHINTGRRHCHRHRGGAPTHLFGALRPALAQTTRKRRNALDT